MGLILLALLATGAVAPGSALAASDQACEEPDNQPASKPEASEVSAVIEGAQEVIEDTGTALEKTACNSALWLDGLMRDGDGDVAAARRTTGYVETSFTESEFFGTDVRIRARVRMELPNWQRRLHVYVGRENQEDFVRDRSTPDGLRSEFSGVGENDQWLAGLGYSLPDGKRLRTDLRIGAASLQHPHAFAQARARFTLYADERDLLYARSTLFWDTRERLGLTTGLEYNRVLYPDLLLRLKESGTISQESEGLEWVSAAILYQRLRKDRGVAWEAFVRGRSQAPEPLREYGARVVFQFPLLRERLIGEVLAGYSWPRTDPDLDREGSYLAGAGLKLLFGEDDDD